MTSDNRRAWHLEKSISVGHIVTTFTIAIGIVFAWADMDNRVDQTILENEHQTRAITRIEHKQEKDKSELVTQIQHLRQENKDDNRLIQEKLDRLIQRQLDER